jgi:HEAT repeat protein
MVFFNESEQKLFKDSFVTAQKIAQIEKTALRPQNKWRRIEAILSLGYAQEAAALKTLRQTILDRDEDVAYFSMLALGQIKSIESAKILLDFLKKNTPSRFKVVSILEDFPPGIIDEVGKLLEDKSGAVRFWAVRLISEFKPERYLKNIEELTRDESEEVRAAACESLGQMGKKEAKDTLSKCLKDEFWLVRANAVKALAKVCGKECLPEVMYLINDGSLSVIDSVKDVMTANIQAALPYIEKFFSGPDGTAKRAAVEALEESGYVVNMFNGILSGNDKERAESINLLEGMIKSQACLGLASALSSFSGPARRKLLSVIADINRPLAEQLSREAGRL